jgi:hypothetical protein
MSVRQIDITDWEAYGNKVKAWAKGIAPRPATVEELAEQLEAANVGATIHEGFERLEFVQEDEHTLIIKLPPKSVLEAQEAAFRDHQGSYPLASYYARVFGTEPKIDDTLAFQAERIGDYTISFCG